MKLSQSLIVVVMCAITGLESLGHAQGLDAERFVPAAGAEADFSFETPTVPFHLGWGLGLFFDLADDSVVERQDDDVISRPLDTAVSADLIGSIGLFGRGELGIHLPLQLVYEGDDAGGLAASSGVGDLRLVPKAALYRGGDVGTHMVLGVAVPITLPTGDEEALRGAGGATVEPRLMLAVQLGALGVGAHVGYRWRSEHPMGLPYGDELTLGGLVSYEVAPESLWLEGELFGGKQIDADVDNADFPLELLGGVVFAVSDSWRLHAGAGLGTTDGVGDPDFRVVAGLRYRHGVPEDDGFTDDDGDGVLDKDDDAPQEPEDADGFEDEDGEPEPDNDDDGIADDQDECPDLPEESGGDGDGCPSKTYVEIEDGKMVVYGKILFKTGSDEIDRKKSDALLDQIAASMQANPQVKKLRIEGHTDDVGGETINERLSKDRAASVKSALEDRGVDDDRLSTKGYGESQPTAPNATRAGRAKNRRVEFIIVE